jgi:hypothetical protein
MARYDLFKKLIEQLGLVLAQLIFKLKKNLEEENIETAIENTNALLKEELGKNLSEIENITEDDFLEILKNNKKLNTENLELLAEVFYLLGKSSNNIFYLQKSKTIIEHILSITKTFSFEYQAKINEIETLVNK